MNESPDRSEMRSDLPDGRHKPPADQLDRPVEATPPRGPDQGRTGWTSVASNALAPVLSGTAGGLSTASLPVGLAVFAVVAFAFALVMWVVGRSRR